MTVSTGAGSVREILVVLALAVAGVLLALVAAFTPWYGLAAGSTELGVVEMHAPSPPSTVGGVAASDR